MSLLSLALALALSARAAAPVVRVQASAPVVAAPSQLHPLILGSLSDPKSPLALQVAFHTEAILKLTAAPQVAQYLETAAQNGPVDLAATKVISEALARQDKPLPELLQTIFDGNIQKPALELDGLGFKRGYLLHEGQKLRPLGSGEFGTVHEHPRIEGAVIKTVDHSAETMLFGSFDPKRTSDQEEASAFAFAEAGAGPRYFGRQVVGGRYMSVRERVYGRTLEQLIGDRKFGPEEQALVIELLRTLARAGLNGDDLRMPNIMIGRTAANGRRRAMVIDGGKVSQLDRTKTEEQRFLQLLHQDTTILVKFDPLVGEVVFTRPFSTLLQNGLDHSSEKTFWQKLKGVLKAMRDMPVTPGIR